MKHMIMLGVLVVLVVLAGCAATIGDVSCSRHLERINPVVGAMVAPTAAKEAASKSPAAKGTAP